MSSPCLSGGGRTYGFDLEIVKSPASTSTRTNSHTSSSPSSTLSESSNSPLAISTRKPRTPRKRPNQNYNEAAALLSTAYPNIFSTTHLSNPRKFTKLPHQDESSSELLWPFRVFDDSGFLLHRVQKPSFLNEAKISNLLNSCDKSDFHGNFMELWDGHEEYFDAESILDEEIEEGIDSIMGNLSVNKEKGDGDRNCWYGNPMGFHFGGKLKGVRALRHGDESNWWSFPIVDMLQISPRLSSSSSKNKVSDSNSNPKIKLKTKTTTTKKKNKVELKDLESTKQENSIPESNSNSGLLLKLNYDDVLKAWSDRGSPFTDEVSGSKPGNEVSIDIFSESGVREVSVLRYKEKRRTCLFSKKIRCPVRKVNAVQRPRIKGRFVRGPNSKCK